MGIKDDFKIIISERLAKAASSIFIDKALAIMDESADNKESYVAAADMIRKRIALFIDSDLAGEVFDVLNKEIEQKRLTPGTRRKHVRVTFFKIVHVTYGGTSHELQAGNLSEGGIYIETKEPFPFGSEVKISLPLEAGTNIQLNGVVVHTNRDYSKHPPGMGIKFKEDGENELRTLRKLIK
jgi:uncharacterized protein (TIGR02266 family)